MLRLYSFYALNKFPAYNLCMTMSQAKRQHHRARSQDFNVANGVLHKPRYPEIRKHTRANALPR